MSSPRTIGLLSASALYHLLRLSLCQLGLQHSQPHAPVPFDVRHDTWIPQPLLSPRIAQSNVIFDPGEVMTRYPGM